MFDQTTCNAVVLFSLGQPSAAGKKCCTGAVFNTQWQELDELDGLDMTVCTQPLACQGSMWHETVKFITWRTVAEGKGQTN